MEEGKSVGFINTSKKYPALGGLMFSLFLVYLAAQAVQGNWNYFTMYRFHWNEKMVGVSLAVVGLLIALVQAVLTRIINPKIGNERSVYLGLVFLCYRIILIRFRYERMDDVCFFGSLLPRRNSRASLQSIMSANVPKNEQGELQGALTSLMNLTTIIGPAIMTNLFRYFTEPVAHFIFRAHLFSSEQF
jgi:DHA1 family tetracycline resistance protein-like MFS transporter